MAPEVAAPTVEAVLPINEVAIPAKEFVLADEPAPFDADNVGLMSDSELEAVYNRTIAKMRLMIDDGLGAVKREAPKPLDTEAAEKSPSLLEAKELVDTPTTAVEGPKSDAEKVVETVKAESPSELIARDIVEVKVEAAVQEEQKVPAVEETTTAAATKAEDGETVEEEVSETTVAYVDAPAASPEDLKPVVAEEPAAESPVAPDEEAQVAVKGEEVIMAKTPESSESLSPVVTEVEEIASGDVAEAIVDDHVGANERSSSQETLAQQPTTLELNAFPATVGPTTAGSEDGRKARPINLMAELDRISIRSAPVFRRVKFSPPSLADDLDGLADEVSTVASDDHSESSSQHYSEAHSDTSYVSATNDVELNVVEARKAALRLMVLLRDLETAAETFNASASAPAAPTPAPPTLAKPSAGPIGLGLLLQEHALNTAAGTVSAATPQAAVLRLAREAYQVAEAFGQLCGLETLSSSSKKKSSRSPNPVTRSSLPPRPAPRPAPSLREMVGRQALMGGPMGPAGMGLGMPYAGPAMSMRRSNYAASVV